MAQLGLRLLSLQDVNHYSQVPYAQMNAGQDFDLYFQLVDLSQVSQVPYTPGGAASVGASGTITYAGLVGGSSVTATLAGISFSQAFVTDNNATVQALADQMNADAHASQLAVASAANGVLTFTAPMGLGALGNSFALTGTVSSGAGAATASGAFLAGGAGAGAAVLRVEVQNINDALVVTRYAAQPYVGLDGSIFKVQLLNTDPISAGTANLRLTLIEGSRQSFVYAQGALRVYPTSQNSTQPGGASGPFGYAAQGL